MATDLPTWQHERQAQAGKVRHVEANPRVAFHLADDGHGGNIITIEGTASFEEAPPELLAAYLAKYDEAIRTALQTTAEQLAVDYPTTIRITPTRSGPGDLRPQP
jgi:PPOX class probable F420-dependent enzyme